ncbi:hypothetical protein [Pseudonocardia sp. TRM90224]|uniref:hypothetical protein n=1 Tax=Pseudonocardia sp. TRM90224 TaxID=2812678 RepID=UPI001E51F9D5|nr:hypothetical protein [Pseudonocardia sp. TRM90224]
MRSGDPGEPPENVFDPALYHESVVRPLRATPRRIPNDLRVRYAISGQPERDALRAHLAAVVGYWRERLDRHDYSRAVYAQLVAAHERLEADPAVDLGAPLFWARYRAPAPDTAHQEAPAIPPPVIADSPAEPELAPPVAVAVPHRGLDVRARRQGATVVLTWLWPPWATEALVEWDGNRRATSLSSYRTSGRWSVELGPLIADIAVEFTVAVRGPTEEHRAWSEAETVMVPGPRGRVGYTVTRLRGRTYRIEFHADRPVAAECRFISGFAATDFLPWSAEMCTRTFETAYLINDRTSVEFTLNRDEKAGFVRAFLVDDGSADVELIDPPIETLRIR